MPMRKRKLREAAQANEKAHLDESMRNVPDHILKAKASQKVRLNDIILAGHEKLLADPNNYPYKLKDGLTTAEENGDLGLKRKAINKGLSKSSANGYRAQERKDTALDLRQRNEDIWGKRGKASTVLKREKKRAPDVKLSIRTIQQYMKDFPF